MSNQDHPAVKIWRDVFRLNLNAGWKKDIIVTVESMKNGEDKWRKFCAMWKKKKWNPMGISAQLSEFERQNNGGT